MHAIYERITVAGPEIVGVRLTAAAYAHGRLFGPLIARTVRRNLDTGLANATAALEAQG